MQRRGPRRSEPQRRRVNDGERRATGGGRWSARNLSCGTLRSVRRRAFRAARRRCNPRTAIAWFVWGCTEGTEFAANRLQFDLGEALHQERLEGAGQRPMATLVLLAHQLLDDVRVARRNPGWRKLGVHIGTSLPRPYRPRQEERYKIGTNLNAYSPAFLVPLLCQVPEAKRINPRLPQWITEQIEPDIASIGRGKTRYGGSQSVLMTALLLYLELPEAERLRLAESITARSEESVRRDFDASWLTKAIRAITALGEEDAAAFVKGIEARLEQKRTSGTAAARRRESPRKSTRRQGA